jgi:hypothetical protein
MPNGLSRNTVGSTCQVFILIFLITYGLLNIRNGGGPTSPLIGTFCGRNIPRTIPSHSHEMFIRLVTDYSLFGRGFRLFWDATSTG